MGSALAWSSASRARATVRVRMRVRVSFRVRVRVRSRLEQRERSEPHVRDVKVALLARFSAVGAVLRWWQDGVGCIGRCVSM